MYWNLFSSIQGSNIPPDYRDVLSSKQDPIPEGPMSELFSVSCQRLSYLVTY